MRRTVYQNDFSPKVNYKRLLTGRELLDNYISPEKESMYKLNYCHGDTSVEPLAKSQLPPKLSRAKSCMPNSERVNVASCLVWHPFVKERTILNLNTSSSNVKSTTNGTSETSTTAVAAAANSDQS